MSMAIKGLGGLIVVVGAGLWIGNMTGQFVTFPYAGYITMAIGGAVFAGGQKLGAKQETA